MIDLRIPIGLALCSIVMNISLADTSQVEAGSENTKEIMIFFDEQPTIISIEFEGYPNDPGDLGDTYLAGIDSDNDGVRDDVERYIVDTYSHDENIRKSLYQYAQYKQQMVLAASNSNSNSIKILVPKIQGAIECLYEVSNSASQADTILQDITSVFLNTEDRIKASIKVDKLASGYVGVLESSGSNTCE